MKMEINQLVIYKYFLHFEKEEAWLEKMALEGWRLLKVSSWGGYTFEKMDPQPLTYKIDFRQFKNKQVETDYLTLFSDSGWTCAAAGVNRYNYYFYTPSGSAPKDIFSDEDSKIQRYQRYNRYLGMSLLAAFMPMMVVIFIQLSQWQQVGYLTPGLWQMTGWEFYSHFLFETPFVLLRLSFIWLPLLMLLVGLFFYLGTRRSLKKELDSGEGRN